ncbi:MAG: TetR family transcriptional regulator [Chloroflexi bacterium]|nr:TetR family transcriptional regulator [Chloroflexota bacterium]
MSIKQRAINQDQKKERRQIILAAALHLFQTSSYEAVNMAAVAEEAKIAKGTFYLYFATKEALFLALQAHEFERWFDQIDARLQATTGALAIETFVAHLSETLVAQPALVRLIAILYSTLEQNIDFVTALEFKALLLRRVLETGPLLEARLPFLRPGEGAQLLLRIQALTIGLYHMAEPAPLVRQVLEQPDLALFKIDFKHEFLSALQTMLQGLAARTLGE